MLVLVGVGVGVGVGGGGGVAMSAFKRSVENVLFKRAFS